MEDVCGRRCLERWLIAIKNRGWIIPQIGYADQTWDAIQVDRRRHNLGAIVSRTISARPAMEFWQLAMSQTIGELPSCIGGYPYPRVAAPDVKRGPAPRDGMRGNSAHPC